MTKQRVFKSRKTGEKTLWGNRRNQLTPPGTADALSPTGSCVWREGGDSLKKGAPQRHSVGSIVALRLFGTLFATTRVLSARALVVAVGPLQRRGVVVMPSVAKKSVEAKHGELEALLDDGVLTRAEFEAEVGKVEGTPTPTPTMTKKRKTKATKDEASEGGATTDGGEGKKKKKKASLSNKQKPKEPLVLEPPEGWRATWDLILELRADRTAVVDSMGSEKLYDDDGDEDKRHYQVLISLMLSSQTKDVTTAATMAKLKAHGLSVDHILDRTTDDDLHEMIKQVGFHNIKTKNIRATTEILRREYGGKVPDSMEGLLALPGVGPKMALIVLRVAHDITAGIAVDTHVHRIANQLNWTGGLEAKTPEKTRAAIEAWMPREIWDDVNLVLVGLGQEIQTEKVKLLRKAAASSDGARAIRLLETLGMNVAKVAAQFHIDLPDR